MLRKLSLLSVTLALFTSLAWAAPKTGQTAEGQKPTAQKSWVGVVSDEQCGLKHNKESAEAASCVAKCVQGGGKYALVYRGKIYKLEPQDKFADFAGKRVKVSGTRSGDAITATDVQADPLRARTKSKKAAPATAGK